MLEALDLLEHRGVVFKVEPFPVPVDALTIFSSLAILRGSLEDEFGHVLVWWTLFTSLCEEVDHGGTFFPTGPK